MIGFGANRRGGRLPSFILIVLLVIIVILSFNYWSVSTKHGRLLDELAEMQTQVKRTDAARSRLEKRNSELMMQVDTHRQQIDQKDGDYSVLESKLQAKDALVKACTDEKNKLQNDVSAQMSEIHRLKDDGPLLKDDMGKPGSDAGMPGIEDSEVGKIEDAQFALKKPAITPQKHMEPAEAAALLKEERAGFGAGAGARPGDDLAHGQPLDLPDMPHDENLHLGNNDIPLQQQLPKSSAVSVLVSLAEGLKAEGVGLPPPPNPAQVLSKHIDQHNGRDPAPAVLPRHRQSRFFDENESPVDPQHGNKLADYNGDDGNVGEYEADKQAELAYNEEEDGDGGEEDVQDDEDREAPGERAVDYGKRHQAIDVL
ncbi:protein CASC4-like [Sinocyclocheilus rhinocerous]|uniref:protein CASC4-like n=1 Tax=Sinocyclocheilus rhinocerous TaxID=307959 RepID=UPI0007B961A8|nr:PREDICTED: protein CASC4-like [Sinocyclocheilus rhinocerous]